MFKFFKKIKNKKEFNLGDYLVSLGYFNVTKGSIHTSYSNGTYTINVFNKENCGYNTMSIYLDDFDLATMRFLPNSEILVDMILKRVQEEVNKNEL